MGKFILENIKTIDKEMMYVPILEPDAYYINVRQLHDLDNAAKASGKILGRYIAMPYADGNVIYQIVAERESEVRIKVCIGLGDDWQMPLMGKENWINRAHAEALIKSRELEGNFS